MEFKEIRLPFRIKKPILALGADIKNTICLGWGNRAFISGIIGDLKEYNHFKNFENMIKTMPKRFKVSPRIIAYDLHPEYLSAKYINNNLAKTDYKPRAIQHHHAHIASCMIENSLNNQKVIGVAFDGTGLGDDSSLWGAEFLICDYLTYERKAHLRYIPLIGGEKAIWQPWRLAMIWLYLIYGDRLFNLGVDFIKKIDKQKWLVLKEMYKSKFNCPSASSMGRLFDAIASLVLNKINVKFEAEAAIELEKKAAEFIHKTSSTDAFPMEPYHFKIKAEKEKYIIDPASLIREIISELKNKQSKERIAYRFHYAVAEAINKVCLRLREKRRINKIVLSGGVFQNKVLLNLSLDLLCKQGFNTFVHNKLSCNDSAISLGQLSIANFKRR